MQSQKTEMHKVTHETIERYKRDYLESLDTIGRTFPSYSQTCREIRRSIIPMQTKDLYNHARVAKISMKDSRNPSLSKLQESMIGYAIVCTAKWFRYQPRRSSEDDFQNAIYQMYLAVQNFIIISDIEMISDDEFEIRLYEAVKLSIYSEFEFTYVTRPVKIADEETVASSNKVVEFLIGHEPVFGYDAFKIIDAYIGLTRPKITVIEISKKTSVPKDKMEAAIKALMSELKNIQF